jgi:hypothetical protein
MPNFRHSLNAISRLAHFCGTSQQTSRLGTWRNLLAASDGLHRPFSIQFCSWHTNGGAADFLIFEEERKTHSAHVVADRRNAVKWFSTMQHRSCGPECSCYCRGKSLHGDKGMKGQEKTLLNKEGKQNI